MTPFLYLEILYGVTKTAWGIVASERVKKTKTVHKESTDKHTEHDSLGWGAVLSSKRQGSQWEDPLLSFRCINSSGWCTCHGVVPTMPGTKPFPSSQRGACYVTKIFRRVHFPKSYTWFGDYFVPEPLLELLKPNEEENKESGKKWKLSETGTRGQCWQVPVVSQCWTFSSSFLQFPLLWSKGNTAYQASFPGQLSRSNRKMYNTL